VDSERLLDLATAFLERYLPRLRPRVRLSGHCGSVLEEMGIHQEIEGALRARIGLKSGGSIVVNQTEALVAIDVNTGRDVGRREMEETILRTNLEAVREIVRLLRLRDLGGIIVIDFIDMAEPKSREILFRALSEELRKDRSRTRLLDMSDFGLVQLTRKRTRRSLDRALRISCPSCGGEGRIRSALVLYYEIQRALARGCALAGPEGPLVRLHPAALGRIEEEGLRMSLPASSSAAPAEPARRGSGDPALAVRIGPDPALSEERYEIEW